MPSRQNKTQPKAIRLKGVRTNNLKGFDLDLPLGKLICVTGLSGTGKSSLVFDTLHAEGQRRYVETFSPYTRQFMELLGRPDVEHIENIRPSIAIKQGNTVKTSRSTVGTMTELCDYFKIWFAHEATLHDPATGEPLINHTPRTMWLDTLRKHKKQTVVLGFPVTKPEKLTWQHLFDSLSGQGYTRLALPKNKSHQYARLDEIDTTKLPAKTTRLLVVQDRITITPESEARFLEAAHTALHFGQGTLQLLSPEGSTLETYHEGLRSPKTGEAYAHATPALFSFNSPVGACPQCRGFGRVIEIDFDLVIPDPSLTLEEGAIQPFRGQVYSESLRDLQSAAKKIKLPMDVPWRDLTDEQKTFIIEGEPDYGSNGREWPHAWYGVRRFFKWLEANTYKMHVRVFLSKYRAYTTCPACNGDRLQPDALHWKWHEHTLPALYKMSVTELITLLNKHTDTHKANTPHSKTDPRTLALEAIQIRLNYLEQVGLGYLSLDRSSRTLSGGEVERVNLTTCLGTALVDTLFVLDEPSIGLHARDIDRLITTLRRLTNLGNTVVVVEHDEAIMRAADHILELGPEPGEHGGAIQFSGEFHKLTNHKKSLTGRYLSGEATIPLPAQRRTVSLPSKQPDKKHPKLPRKLKSEPRLTLKDVTKNNLNGLDVAIPLNRLVCLAGVSGSGKSTLLNHAIYDGLRASLGHPGGDPAKIKSIQCDVDFSEIVLVDQSPVSRTPRSNPALFSDAWDRIRELFGHTDAARTAGMNAASFSFNSGHGRCEHCQGLGYEKVEMQFLSDVFVPCPACEGQRFKPEVLAIKWSDVSVSDVLNMDVHSACELFKSEPRVLTKLETLKAVGLGYLRLGQPLNTLSGGESQRLKLVRYLSKINDEQPALLLLDEPTTGLHRDDIKRLLKVLQQLVDAGHSLIVIEHQTDVLAAADWLIELGPEAGEQGGKLVATGTPEAIANAGTATAPFLKSTLSQATSKAPVVFGDNVSDTSEPLQMVAEEPIPFDIGKQTNAETEHPLTIIGAREHNLRNLSLTLPRNELCVITGVSGSGKSSLAFDLIFSEGQRRFMESMSAYARQFVEQLPRADVDSITGIAPTVAIEQRVTRGSRKSTVATITEVAQYLRLLFARVGIQHSLHTGEPLTAQAPSVLKKRFLELVKTNDSQSHLYLCAPVIRGRKGHHEPLATWAREHGYEWLRCDGKLVSTKNFKRLDRYREHDIELIVADFGTQGSSHNTTQNNQGTLLETALKLGKGAAFLLSEKDDNLAWFSTSRTDPTTGEAYPELDPKHFSWNSPRGWCETCRGYGYVISADYENMADELDIPPAGAIPEICPDCEGARLNPVSRAVRIYDTSKQSYNLPELLAQTSEKLVTTLRKLKLDKRGQLIVRDILPQIEERLKFMSEVGLAYLTLDRATVTLSGGEAQRIRLAAQLGSNLSGVLYVLDEPSIGLHARDNERLIQSLHRLRDAGNSVLVVEHDDDTMRAADRIIDLGPGAGIHGGEIVAEGTLAQIKKNKESLTGRYLTQGISHPLNGSYRTLPKRPKRNDTTHDGWLILKGCALRNLKGFDVQIPHERLTMVCGISGAGKSTLIHSLLKPAIKHAITSKQNKLAGAVLNEANLFERHPHDTKPPLASLSGATHCRTVVEIDQEPIGKTPRSTPATYIGAFDLIRELYSNLPESRMHGYTASTFSFNTKGGRCETCKGAGRVKLEMNFLPETYVPCESCGGSRFGNELAEIRWNGKNISDVLEMSFEEAAEFFGFHSRLKALMELMVETGLGYLTLGQSSPTLSGGEAQRLKLVSELARGLPTFKDKKRGVTPKNLYLLEEPTIGLHLSDCERLIQLLHRLVDQGHTVIVIEHHLDLIAEADYVVEIGPEGGDAGGKLVYQGNLAGLLKSKKSPTVPYLKQVIKSR